MRQGGEVVGLFFGVIEFIDSYPSQINGVGYHFNILSSSISVTVKYPLILFAVTFSCVGIKLGHAVSILPSILLHQNCMGCLYDTRTTLYRHWPRQPREFEW